MKELLEERINEELSMNEKIALNSNIELCIKIYKLGYRDGFNWTNKCCNH